MDTAVTNQPRLSGKLASYTFFGPFVRWLYMHGEIKAYTIAAGNGKKNKTTTTTKQKKKKRKIERKKVTLKKQQQ